ncbi:protein transport protein S31, partial [Mortierella antarctica]
MRQKTISRTSTFAWSPGQHAPLLATGTVAGAFDANFSNTSQLEIFDLNLTDKSPESIELSQPAGVVASNARFNRLAWASPTVDRPYGMIAGGMENGELNLWDANAILNGSNDVLFSKQSNHSGPVRGLHFNPFQQNLLSSASSNGEIFIWDLGNLTKPYTPGSRSSKLEDITCVAWNNHVQHILATSSTTGYTVVWDLKSKREVLTLSYPGASVGGGSMGNLGQMGASRRGITAIAWNPDVATQIITATEDDNNPVILVWDLRYAHAPEKTLSGHTKGILSLSWCQQDSDLLLSAGKDCRSLCWNPKSGEIIGELPQSSSWTFDIDWCPRNPDLLASASFDGKINIHSIQSTHDNDSAAAGSHAHQEAHDPFAPQQYQTQGPAAAISLKQPPKWLRRPVGATFGFGGKLAIFRNRPAPPLNLPPGAVAPVGVPTTISSVTLANITTEQELVQRAADLEMALDTKTLDKFCENRSQSNLPEAEYWTILRALFEANPREQLVHHLGFDKQEIVDQVAALTRQMSIGSNPATSPVAQKSEPISGHLQNHRASTGEMNSLFSAGHDGQDDTFANYSSNNLASDFKVKASVPFQIYPASDTDIDKKITRCIVAGDFESAVNVCLHDGRLSDALVLAICGGPELLERTQKAYFERLASSTPYIRLLQSVVTGDLEDVVRNADLADWQEIVVILCTFARPDEFGRLCESLGNRLEQQWVTKVQAGEPASATNPIRCNTVLCYLAAGNLERVVAIWIQEQEEELAFSGNESTVSEYEHNARSLQAFIEKVTVFRKAIDYVDVAIAGNPNEDHPEEQEGQHKLAALYDKYAEYAEIMAAQGRLSTAVEYLNLTPVDFQSHDSLAVMRDRLYHSGVDVSKLPAPEFPFQPVYVSAEG